MCRSLSFYNLIIVSSLLLTTACKNQRLPVLNAPFPKKADKAARFKRGMPAPQSEINNPKNLASASQNGVPSPAGGEGGGEGPKPPSPGSSGPDTHHPTADTTSSTIPDSPNEDPHADAPSHIVRQAELISKIKELLPTQYANLASFCETIKEKWGQEGGPLHQKTAWLETIDKVVAIIDQLSAMDPQQKASIDEKLQELKSFQSSENIFSQLQGFCDDSQHVLTKSQRNNKNNHKMTKYKADKFKNILEHVRSFITINISQKESILPAC